MKYLSFTKKEMTGIVFLFIIITAILLAPLFIPSSREQFNFSDFKKDIDLFYASEVKRQHQYIAGPRKVRSLSISYFKFDPNVIDLKSWKKLGVPEYTARMILKFVSKKGRFYKPDDLKKIYSISAEDYRRLEPYIDIPDKKINTAIGSSFLRVEKREPKPVIELNSADSVALESINGIGPAFAKRIIKYRDRLGGFNTIQQLREVYGIDSAKFEQIEKQITVNADQVRKMPVNNAGFDDLKKHPYLSYKQINAILQYRKQHGTYNSPADLLKTGVIREEDLARVAGYLSF